MLNCVEPVSTGQGRTKKFLRFFFRCAEDWIDQFILDVGVIMFKSIIIVTILSCSAILSKSMPISNIIENDTSQKR